MGQDQGDALQPPRAEEQRAANWLKFSRLEQERKQWGTWRSFIVVSPAPRFFPPSSRSQSLGAIQHTQSLHLTWILSPVAPCPFPDRGTGRPMSSSLPYV